MLGCSGVDRGLESKDEEVIKGTVCTVNQYTAFSFHVETGRVGKG